MGFDASVVPLEELRTDEYLLRPITAEDAQLDYDAVMESKEFLRKWEQSTWPADDFTVEANRKDMEKMERRHQKDEAYGYTVLNLEETECLGCVYVFPPDAPWYSDSEKAAASDKQWSDYRAVVAFWIRKSRLADGLDRRLLETLRSWLRDDWQIDDHLFITNEEFEQQVGIIEDTDLELRFRLADPENSGDELAFG